MASETLKAAKLIHLSGRTNAQTSQSEQISSLLKRLDAILGSKADPTNLRA